MHVHIEIDLAAKPLNEGDGAALSLVDAAMMRLSPEPTKHGPREDTGNPAEQARVVGQTIARKGQ